MTHTTSYKLDELAEELSSGSAVIVEARCTRDNPRFNSYNLSCDGRIIGVFRHEDQAVAKIGLYPSKADLDLGSLDPVFDSELDSRHRRELGRAVGLRAHGVGIGAFVYLRRIIESLVEEAHRLAKAQEDWSEEDYQSGRVSDRIAALKGYLPSRLVKTAHLYRVLSKGVHELTEEECLKHFDLLFQAIAMILKERSEEKEYAKIVRDIDKVGAGLASATPAGTDAEQGRSSEPNHADGAED